MTDNQGKAVQSLYDALVEFRGKKHSDARSRFVQFCAAHIHTPSQIYQDLFVLFALKMKTGGFFVEFGATDGVGLSNTLLLERKFGWSGILAEPGRRWHESLRANRSSIVDTRCVWSETGKAIEFLDAESGELSTVKGFEDLDFNKGARVRNVVYPVNTISLNDLLIEHSAPSVIDYLSIDTEGTEFEILSSFDFEKFKIRVVSIEHNYVLPARDNLKYLMEQNGFFRVFESFSKWDDWYINRSLLHM